MNLNSSDDEFTVSHLPPLTGHEPPGSVVTIKYQNNFVRPSESGVAMSRPFKAREQKYNIAKESNSN